MKPSLALIEDNSLYFRFILYPCEKIHKVGLKGIQSSDTISLTGNRTVVCPSRFRFCRATQQHTRLAFHLIAMSSLFNSMVTRLYSIARMFLRGSSSSSI